MVIMAQGHADVRKGEPRRPSTKSQSLVPHNGAAPEPAPLRTTEPDDLVALYLAEISRYPLLTFEDEQELGRRIAAGDQAARQRMVDCNLRLVVSVARRYLRAGLPLLDLIQEGNIGLMRAAARFDYTRGYRFSTYAIWWIRQAMSRGLADTGHLIRVPVHIMEGKGKLLQEMERSRVEGDDAVAADTAGAAGIAPAELRHLLDVLQSPLSLDQPAGEDDEGSLADIIEDRSVAPTETLVDDRMLRRAMAGILRALPDRERRIIELHYGLDGAAPRSFAEISATFGLTRERIRQLEAGALALLRRQPEVARLGELAL